MMNWKKIKPLVLTIIAALLVVLISGTAVANRVGEAQIVKMNTDVVVPEQQTLTEAVAFGGSVTLLEDGEVTNDAVAIGGDVVLKANARVGGDAVAIGGEIFKEEGATVNGSEVAIFSDARVIFDQFGLFGTIYLVNTIFYLTALVVVLAFGIFLLLLLPGHLQTIATTMYQHPFKSGMWGLGGIIAIILFVALFAGSVFGFLLIPIVNLAFAVAGLLGAIATCLWIGKKILPRRKISGFMSFLVGILILFLISLIPVAGGLIVLTLNLFGFGAVLLSRVGTVPPEKIRKNFDHLEGTASASGS